MLRILPTLPMLRIEPALPMLKTLPMLPILRMLPALRRLRMLSTLAMLPRLNRLVRVGLPRAQRARPRMCPGGRRAKGPVASIHPRVGVCVCRGASACVRRIKRSFPIGGAMPRAQQSVANRAVVLPAQCMVPAAPGT